MEAVEGDFVVGGVHENAVLRPAGLAGENVFDLDAGGFAGLRIGRHDADDRQVEFRGEIKVARIVGGNGHDGARAVADENVVGDPDRNLHVVDGIDRVGSREFAGLLLRVFRAGEIGLRAGDVDVFVNSGLAVRRRDFGDERMFGGEHHVGGAEQRVRTRRVDADRFVGIRDFEIDFRASGAADPVLLHFLRAFRPVQTVDAVEKLLRVVRDFEDPLADRLADDREVADFGTAVDDLFVGEHGAERGAPVHWLVGFVGEAFFIEFGEYPLRPFVVAWIRGVYFAIPVEGEAKHLQLLLERGDVFGGGDGGMRSRFDGVLFGGQAEGVPSHRVQDVVAVHAFETAPDIRRRIAFRMADMQAGAGGIGEHVENVEFFPRLVAVHGLEGFVFLPEGLPFRFDFSGGVSVGTSGHGSFSFGYLIFTVWFSSGGRTPLRRRPWMYSFSRMSAMRRQSKRSATRSFAFWPTS